MILKLGDSSLMFGAVVSAVALIIGFLIVFLLAYFFFDFGMFYEFSKSFYGIIDLFVVM